MCAHGPGLLADLCRELKLEGVTGKPVHTPETLGSRCTSEAERTAEEPPGVGTSHPQGHFGLYFLRKHTFPWVGRPEGNWEPEVRTIGVGGNVGLTSRQTQDVPG